MQWNTVVNITNTSCLLTYPVLLLKQSLSVPTAQTSTKHLHVLAVEETGPPDHVLLVLSVLIAAKLFESFLGY